MAERQHDHTGQTGEGASESKSSRKRKSARKSDGANKRSAGSKQRKPEYLELAKKYDRCLKCGWHYKPADMAAHAAKCEKDDAGLFNSRMGKVEAMLAKGKTASQINNFPTKNGAKGSN